MAPSPLQNLWFILIGILWTGYFFLEGFDFGVGILLPFLARDDVSRRVMINTVGPVWDGNEVWLIVAGGATFAAFPVWYSTLFSGFYLALLVILLALIVRAVAFEFRSKERYRDWRQWWDRALFFGSLVPALLWGVAFSDMLRGVPISANQQYVGTVWELLHPYALLGGVAFVLLFTLHGALFLVLRTRDDVQDQARRAARRIWAPTVLAVFAYLLWSYLNALAVHDKGVVPDAVPLAGLGAVIIVGWLLRERLTGWAFVSTSAAIVLVTVTIFLNLYPRLMVSSIDPNFSLTIVNASSRSYTLAVMTIVALIFIPLVLLYQGWTYWVFRQRLGRHDVTGGY